MAAKVAVPVFAILLTFVVSGVAVGAIPRCDLVDVGSRLGHNTVGNPTRQAVGPLEWPATPYETDPRGAVESDTSEPTNTITDLLGRPLRREYADGTAEVIEWEGPRTKSVTDRRGRKQHFGYNGKGQLEHEYTQEHRWNEHEAVVTYIRDGASGAGHGTLSAAQKLVREMESFTRKRNHACRVRAGRFIRRRWWQISCL